MAKTWKETMAQRALFERARAVLKMLGHPYIHSTGTVRRLIVSKVGNAHLPDNLLVELFERSVLAAPAAKLVKSRPYVLDPAMQRLAARAASQPTIIPVNSRKELSR